MTTKKDIKELVKELRKSFSQMTQSQAYEKVAKDLGYKDWNTLAAELKRKGL